MKNCIKEANTKIINDTKKWFNKSNTFMTVAGLFLMFEFIAIAEILNAYIPYPSPLVGTTVAIIFIALIGVQILYAVYLHDACMEKDD